MKRKRVKVKKKSFILILILVLLILFGIILYINIHGLKSNLKIKLVGKDNISIEVGTNYKEKGYSASYGKNIITKKVKVNNNINNKKLGTYKVSYTVKYKKVAKTIERIVKVVDTTKPEITLSEENVNIVVGNEYVEPGYSAKDNYDGDITDKVEVTNNIDINTIGTYEVTYKVKDSSNNENSIKRTVNVISKQSVNQKVAVLNYHFFYDSSRETCSGGSNCLDINEFKKQLDYLKNNNYKTLKMSEFRDWMYGKIEIPEKSVLITIDDGGMGTGKQNGDYLGQILDEYKMYGTLFLITGWWDISNYKGHNYLEIESHTNDMHNEGWCDGVTRGARMLCQNNEQVLTDLKKSIEIIGSKKAFCFPFYAYDDRTINLVKEAGFELAFIGGGYKASRNTDKWHVPRYQVLKTTSLDSFISMVS